MDRSPRLPHQKVLPVIAAVCVVMLVILLAHYATGQTPSGIAVTIPVLGLPVYWYGVVIMSAIALATWMVSQLLHTLAIREFEQTVSAEIRIQPLPPEQQTDDLKTEGDVRWQQALSETDHHPDHAWSIVVYMIVLGIIGARLYHVLTPQPSLGITPAYYFANPLEMINLRNGGLGIFGAIAGAALGLLIYVRRHRLSLPIWLDLGALAGAFAQFIGRWANYFNQELYGKPTALPWGITIDNPPSALAQFEQFHPAFLYESVWSLLTFLLLYRLWPARRPGTLAAVYIACYGFGRIALETIRIDSNTTGGIATASLVSGSMVLCGLAWLFWSLHKE